MPRLNSHSSTVATLRKTIAQYRGRSFTQGDLARRAGVARITIQSVERGVFALSEQTARRIAEATGAGAEWLLRGKPSSQAKDAHGRNLTREIWLAHENDLPKRHGTPEQRHSRQARHRVAVNVSAVIPTLASAARSAASERRLDLFAADLREAVKSLVARYGQDEHEFVKATHAMTQSIGVRVAEPGFPASLPSDRLCKMRYFSFGHGTLEKGQELDHAAAMNDANVYAVTVEVKPSATAEEIRAIYPRPKVKAAKKVAKRRKKRA